MYITPKYKMYVYITSRPVSDAIYGQYFLCNSHSVYLHYSVASLE